MQRILVDNVNFSTFKPLSNQVIGNFLRVKFDIPSKPMRFDVSGDAWHNPRGKQPNFGFSLINASGVDIISEEPSIINGDTLLIKCSESPTGATLKYATNGHYGGGNLCDSQNITINNKATDYIIDNFAITLDNYTI